MAHLAIDFSTERGGDGVQARGRDFLEIAFLNLILEFFKLPGQHFPALVTLAEDPLGERLGFGGAKVGDLELMLAAPFDKRGLGDVEFDLDTVEAPTLRAQEDEAGDSFLVGHIFSGVRHQVFGFRFGHAPSGNGR